MPGGISDPMTRVGYTNKKWGVCGFTSTLYAMYDLNPASRPLVINASQAFRVLAEIKTYLVMLQADGSPLLKEIRDFTRTFGPPYDTFEVEDYIQHIREAAADGLSRTQVLGDPLFSIALPPKAVADYVQRVWGWKATVSEHAVGSGGGDGVIGVSSSATDDNGLPKPYHGLEHYMYRHGGKIYSWGQSFNSVQDAADEGAGGVAWRVCHVIGVSKA